MRVLVIDTKAHHALVDGQYGARRAACEEAAALLGVETLREVGIAGLDDALAQLPDEVMRRRVRHVVTEIDRVTLTADALRAGELAEVGRLFVASHESLRDDFEVSCDELDAAVESALAAGALGARMTGGGFGGSAIALVPGDRLDAVADAVRARFAHNGFGAPDIFSTSAAAGARSEVV